MSDTQRTYASQQKLIAALRDPRCYPQTVKTVQVIETHISWVLLAGEYAYKIKKALDLGFLNYSGLDVRQSYCAEEIRLNRRTAPDIYLDVVSIGGSLEHPEFGAQPAIEYAVRMRRFASTDLMDRQLMQGKVTPRHIDALAAVIATFHASLPAAVPGSVFGTAASVHAAALQNLEQLRSYLTGDADRDDIAALKAATEAEYSKCEDMFEARRSQGFVRECHGDLHLG
ncbi:MAG TPA: hypothetical protein VKO66_04985, partial [Sideroxyarcus sp.]|nr:hypothetical protein [Sideroxyarcus sp.]